jgi:hypothetical protein
MAIWTLIRFRFSAKNRVLVSEAKSQAAPFPVGFYRAPAE